MPKYALTQKGTPSSDPAPTALDALLTQIRTYTEIDTNSDDPDSDTVRSILVQPTAPTGASANDLWVKTHSISGRPLGLYTYTGTEWRIFSQTDSGTTNNRPSDAVAGEVYWDTDINVMLVYTGSAWVTQDGSPGDMKYVYIDSGTYAGFATGKARAETLNPGWEYATDAEGAVLVGTVSGDSDSDYLTAGNTFGSRDHTLTEAEMPAHTHDFAIDGNNGSADGTVIKSSSTTLNPHTKTTDSTGSGDAHENRQPSYTAFLMRKLGY